MTGDFLLKELEDEVITQKEITRSINGCIGALDGSVQPPKKRWFDFFFRYVSGSSATCCQKCRDGILETY